LAVLIVMDRSVHWRYIRQHVLDSAAATAADVDAVDAETEFSRYSPHNECCAHWLRSWV